MRTKKVRRVFSTSFKIEKVASIERGDITVMELSRRLDVSNVRVYKWVEKYGTQPRGEKIVIEA